MLLIDLLDRFQTFSFVETSVCSSGKEDVRKLVYLLGSTLVRATVFVKYEANSIMAATRLPSCVDGNTEKRLFNLIILAVLTPVLSGCAAPASIVQPNDAQLRCRDIDAEMQSNETRIKEIHIANIGQNTTTAAVGSVGATVFPPLLLALPVMQIFNSSFSDRSDIETLRSRNAHLAELRTKRGCRASRAN